MQRELDAQQAERDRVLAQYRRGRISERDLDHQLDEIAREEAVHIEKRERLMQALQTATDTEQRLEHARTLLQRLHARVDAAGADGITNALKHEIVAGLVREIRVDTVEVGLSQRKRIKRRAAVHVFYVFDEPTEQRQQSCDALQTVYRSR